MDKLIKFEKLKAFNLIFNLKNLSMFSYVNDVQKLWNNYYSNEYYDSTQFKCTLSLSANDKVHIRADGSFYSPYTDKNQYYFEGSLYKTL